MMTQGNSLKIGQVQEKWLDSQHQVEMIKEYQQRNSQKIPSRRKYKK